MSELTLHKFSYKDLREGKYKSFDDPYGVVSFMTDHLRDTMLACPNNKDETKTALYVMSDGNKAVGRLLEYETYIMAGDVCVLTQTGSSLYVEDSYRSQGVGVDLLIEQKNSKEYNLKISCLFSEMVVPMLKKMKYSFFDMQQYVTIRDTRPMVASFGLKGFFLKTVSAFTNIPIVIMNAINTVRRRLLLKKFFVKKECTVPEWVTEMVLKDSHKYKEVHNREWFQWNLDYNMNGYQGDTQSFYSVYNKEGLPMGFFMTKERFEKVAGRYRNIIRGTIVEWGTADPTTLTESDLNLLAINTFSPKTFHVLTVTTDKKTTKALKRMGFINHGILQMSVLDRKKQFSDIQNQDLWRLRYGCGSTIIFGQVPKE